MGTHCYIGIEDKDDGSVRYVYVHYDGYFSHIVPILRKHYMERKNVEELIECGDMTSLLLPHQCTKGETQNEVLKHRYEFEIQARKVMMHYFYLFTKEEKWECQSAEMFTMDQLKF